MKLRKIVALILALAMTLTMAACSKDPEKTPASSTGKEASANAETDNTVKEDAQQPAADTEANAQQDELPISLEDEDKNDKVGYVSGNTYRNPYFDLTFTAPENATYFDAQTLLSMAGAYNLPADTDAAFAAQMEQNGAYVMMVTDLYGVGANLLVKKTPDAYKGLNDEQLYALAKTEQEGQLQVSGLTGTVEVGSTAFLGETYTTLNTTMPDAGMMQQQIYLVQDDYTCIITASATEVETLADVFSHFAP